MSEPLRSLGGLAGRLVRSWWRQLAAVAVACGVVSATISGGLGVGDVIRAGLLRRALEGLGRIDVAVVGEGFFRRGLAEEMADADPDAPRLGCTPAIVMPVTLTGSTGAARATLLACDDPAALGFTPPPPPLLGQDSLLVNRRLATALGVAAGDTLVLRLPRRSAVPADSPLGRRSADSLGRRLRVAAVLPDTGLGSFSLRPSQVVEPLAILSLTDAQGILREGDVANAVFVVPPPGLGRVDVAEVQRRLRPRLVDYAAAIEPVAAPDGTATLRLSSRRLLIPPAIDVAAARVLAPLRGRPTLAFLANDLTPLASGTGPSPVRVPYSTILGIDATTLPGGRLEDAAGNALDVPLDDEIILDRWVADDFAAQGRPVEAGDFVQVTAFMPETIHGRIEERTESFRVAGIAEMKGAAIDRSLVPDVEGVSDEESIADWDPPFPFDAARVRTVPPHDEDDRYWKRYRATPKAFVSLAAARRLAGSRFGDTTAWHLAGSGEAPDALAARLASAIDPARAGIRALPLRVDAETAARGSTPFGGLFLALSAFVVVAGLLLVWLLFGLIVTAQARTLGTLAAVGFPPSRLAVLLLIVAGTAAIAGAAAGMLVGPIWARFLVGLLGHAWDRDVVAGSEGVFANGAMSAASGVAGAAAALAMAVVALASAAWRVGRQPPLAMLRGAGPVESPQAGRWLGGLAMAALVVAAIVAGVAGRSPSAAQVGLFFGAGFAALAGLLALVRFVLGGRPARTLRSLPGLAARSLAARPSRAFSIAAIVACGQFLVVAVSAFAVRPPADPADRGSPTGGWTTIVTLGEPTSVDPTDAEAHSTLGLSSDQERALAGCEIARLRVSDGDDASCTNLFATTRPSILGAGPSLIRRGGFRFVDHEPLDGAAAGNPWRLIERPEWNGDTAVPAILDQATAQWGLKLGGVGSRFMLADESGTPVECRIVGLLEPGILQGRVVIAEQLFERLFPSRSGYAMALVDDSGVDPSVRAAVPSAVRAAWADAGVSLEPAIDRLRALLAVQNTFLAGFQALGTLGLLLGTAGVAAVQLQGVAERSRGLAALRALGFSLTRVRALLAFETLLNVALGIVAGTLAGTLTIWPAMAGGAARLPLSWIALTGGLTLLSAAAAGWLATARTAIPERPGV